MDSEYDEKVSSANKEGDSLTFNGIPRAFWQAPWVPQSSEATRSAKTQIFEAQASDEKAEHSSWRRNKPCSTGLPSRVPHNFPLS